MRRLAFSAMLLLIAAPVLAQVSGGFTTRMTVQASCAAATCNAMSPTWCVESPFGGTIYLCDVTSGLYEGIASGTPCAGAAVCDTEASTFSALQTFSSGLTVSAGTAKLQVNSVSLDRETLLVYPGEAGTLDISTGFNHLQPTSVEVRSGCLTYDFALYPDDDYTIGDELLFYQGQNLNLTDGAPPMLRDDDLTGEVHAKFWNRGSMGCTFRLILTGGGF